VKYTRYTDQIYPLRAVLVVADMDIPIGTTCSTRVKLLSLIEDIEIVAR